MQPGTVVMVPVGGINAVVNGGPCIIAWAVVRGPADDMVSAPPGTAVWLDVYLSRDTPPLAQMYRADEILGVPALGLTMEGAPPPAGV